MTRAEDVRQMLEQEIVSGARAPGTPLDEIELAHAFNVSRTPIREALRQLEAEGFAQSRPRRGTVVAVKTAQEVTEMFFVMAELEAICGRLAAKAMTAGQITKLDQVRRRCEEAVAKDAIVAYQSANDEFHNLIYEASHNTFLMDMTRSVSRRVAFYRRAQFYSPGRLQRSLEEHDRIFKFISERDDVQAARELRAHIFKVENAFYLKAGTAKA